MRAKLKWIVLAACGLYLASPAGAQPKPAPSAAPNAPNANVGVEKKAQLTPAEQLTETDVALAKMQSTATAVRNQLASARKENDAIKFACLDDKLNQLDVAVRSVRDRRTALQAAASGNNVELANHEFTVIQVHRQRSEQLAAEANLCIGNEASTLGTGQVQVNIDPSVSRTEEAPYPKPESNIPGIIEPPQCISCAK
jgi:hypothetical protein